ncbi:hypothetical protein QQP08_017271 [Theobroma cacao]|nr:hypothetical protein QQP08_017271 [Theobroma cacao]
MDNETGNVEETSFSALQVNELFLRKILTGNNSSMDQSVTIPYRRSVGTVPFQWESRPGTPRHHLVPRKEIVPPVTPPPASSTWNSQEFDKHCINMSRETRAGFWKKSKKNYQGKKKAKGNIDEFGCYMTSSSTNSRSSSSTSSERTSSRLRQDLMLYYKVLRVDFPVLSRESSRGRDNASHHRCST